MMDIDALLAPVAASSPCGEDMSFSIEFDQIAEMRREDDPTLDQGEWITALKSADWPGVAASCSGLLAARTKDLRLAMWLTEAWATLNGFPGLEKGLRLCARLCESYWSDLHPQAEGGDFDERVGNIGWLLQRVVSLAPRLPVTHGRQGAAYSLQDLASAKQLHAALERHPDEAARLTADRVTLDQFNRALKETPAATLLDNLAAARLCADHVLTWQKVIDAHLGAEGPGFVQAKDALATVVHDIEKLARDSGALATSAGGSGHSSGAHADLDDASGLNGVNGMAAHSLASPSEGLPRFSVSGISQGGPPQTRAQALQQLREVAAFFRQSEPHSPVAYLAEKAVKWGEMPLHEWLRKVVKDQGAMAHLHELLGLDGEAEGAESH